MAIIINPDDREVSDDIEALQDRIEACSTRAAGLLELLRQGLCAFAASWCRETAKLTAVNQNEHTLRLGRGRVRSLKHEIEALVDGLQARIERRFSVAHSLDTDGVSSGQVEPLLERRLRKDIYALLCPLMPLLVRAGYERDATWLDSETPERNQELPADLNTLIDEIANALAEAKVCESKIVYVDQRHRKHAAERLWEGA